MALPRLWRTRLAGLDGLHGHGSRRRRHHQARVATRLRRPPALRRPHDHLDHQPSGHRRCGRRRGRGGPRRRPATGFRGPARHRPGRRCGRVRRRSPRRHAGGGPVSLFLTILAAGVITYVTRASLIIAGDRVTLPDQVERALKYVAPAAFAAIGAPALLGGDQFAAFGDDLPRIIAVVLAGVVITKTRSVPLSLFAGMSALWLILWVS
ncbi:MAG TPA: hypothetical protein DFK16_02140 [Acidimicrobiaceae bacterium]|nr:hypothetical protein [Acidimicrobiaceae bacterium]HCH79538.1 hypothetical protein [Acidimicrobiaceae bacterium]